MSISDPAPKNCNCEFAIDELRKNKTANTLCEAARREWTPKVMSRLSAERSTPTGFCPPGTVRKLDNLADLANTQLLGRRLKLRLWLRPSS